jgi:hypothetical protein
VYRILSVGSDFHEICDECGFHGGTLDLSATVARIRALPDRWSEVMSQDEEQLRARPEPDTWCAVEYAQHVLNAIESIEWAARVFAAGRSPDWDELSEDSLQGVFEHDTRDCDRFDIADTLESLGAVARSMATFAESLTPEEQAVIPPAADYLAISSPELGSELHVVGGGGRESNPPDEGRSSRPL